MLRMVVAGILFFIFSLFLYGSFVNLGLLLLVVNVLSFPIWIVVLVVGFIIVSRRV